MTREHAERIQDVATRISNLADVARYLSGKPALESLQVVYRLMSEGYLELGEAIATACEWDGGDVKEKEAAWGTPSAVWPECGR